MTKLLFSTERSTSWKTSWKLLARHVIWTLPFRPVSSVLLCHTTLLMQQSTCGYYYIIYSLTTVYGMATFQQKKRPRVIQEMREKYVLSFLEIFSGVSVPPIVKVWFSRDCLVAGHPAPHPVVAVPHSCGVGKQRHNYGENCAENELKIMWRAAN